MKQLVLKDFRVVGKIYLFLFGLCIFFSTMSMWNDNGFVAKLLYMLSIAVFVIFPHMSITGKDIKYDSYRLFNSLPITRSSLVMAKYIFVFLNIVASTLFMIIYTNLLKLSLTNTFLGNPMSFIDVFFISSLLLVFFSVNLFVTFFSIEKAQCFNQISYMLIVLIPTAGSKILMKTNLSQKLNYIATFDLNIILYFIFIFSVTLYIISMQLSKAVYQRKEF